MKRLLTIALLSFPIFSFGQNADNRAWILKTNATALIDIFSFPTLEVSVERRFKNNFAINVEAGYQLYDFRQTDTAYLKPAGMKANVEVRFYIMQHLNASKLKGLYVGLQGFYRQNQYSSGMTFYHQSDPSTTYKDSFGVDKTALGANSLVGYELVLGKKFVIDAYLGLGVMNKIVKNTQLQYNETTDKMIGTDLVPLFTKLDLGSSSGASGNITFGVRVGLKLGK